MAIFYLLLALVPVAVVFGASTEHAVTDSVHFYYEPDNHYFVASTKTKCYFVILTRDESDHVHTTIGVEDLEIKMMHDWIGVLPETKIYHDAGAVAGSSLMSRWCGHKDIFLLERSNVTLPMTSQSPLAGK